jgi:predicted RNase H-like nuclease (RuvC/YqgF family)
MDPSVVSAPGAGDAAFAGKSIESIVRRFEPIDGKALSILNKVLVGQVTQVGVGTCINELGSCLDTANDRITRVNEDIKQSEGIIKKAAAKVNQLKSEITDLNSQINGLRAENVDLEGQIGSLRSELDSLGDTSAKERENMEDRITELENTVSKNEATIRNLGERKAACKRKIMD